MTLQQLVYVTKIVECGSINEAAKRLFITQPSLSSAVKELEREMGIEIFNRSPRGISLSVDGAEFLSYARQIIEQTELLTQRYRRTKKSRRICSVSTQHYAFAVNAFVSLIESTDTEEYEFTLRETRTYDIIEDVSSMRSEIGIIYQNSFNTSVITKILREKHLAFHPLFEATPHIFVSIKNPLAQKACVTLDDLEDYPCLSFEQGTYNSFYFSEEILSTAFHKKSILVSDRATLFNLLIGLNGYTISSGVLSSDLNGDNIVSIPLSVDEKMLIGWIVSKKAMLSSAAEMYIEKLKEFIAGYGFTVME